MPLLALPSTRIIEEPSKLLRANIPRGGRVKGCIMSVLVSNISLVVNYYIIYNNIDKKHEDYFDIKITLKVT